MTNTKLVHVPYKGGGPALIGLIAGEAQMQISDVIGASPHVRAGRVRGVAVTAMRRTPTFPEIPTLNEAGVRGYDVTGWYGMLAPAKMPNEIVARLNGEVTRIMRSPDAVEQFARAGSEPSATTPAEFGAYIRAETEKWRKVVKAAGIGPE
jgi:tripartite-type tricarboxylate transporter receptor subunit TctC